MTKARLLPFLVAALRDLRRIWPQLVLADLLARLLAVAVLTPAVGVLLKVFLATTPTGVVTDEAIVSFLLHPAGLTALLIIGAVSLGIVFAETGQLMVIGYGAAEDRRVTWLDALLYVCRRAPRLVELAGHALARLLAVSLPFVAAVGGIYWLLARRHDINYYLARHPPEFKAAVVVAGLLLMGMGMVIVVRIAGWLLSVPMVLFEGTGGTAALRASERATAGHRRKLAGWLIGWLAAAGGLSASVTYVVGVVGGVLAPPASSNLTLFLAGMSIVIVVSGIANLAVSVFSTVLFPLLVVRVYRTISGPGELRPRLAAQGSLGQAATLRISFKAVVAAFSAVLLAIAGGAYLASGDLDWVDRSQVIAHRGGAAVAPENTMAAFERGIADGADWLELDVQENADGEVVVEHDRDFMRSAGVPLEVWRATNDDLADLDVGSSFGPQFAGERVPTLRQVLELARDRAGVFIELKYYGRDVDLERRVVNLVEETGMEARVTVMSLSYDGLRRTAALRPGWTYGLLNAVAVGDLARLEVNFLALTADAASIPMIRRAHRRGLKIYAWTIDDPVQMWVMMSRGVDGIITDQVATACRVKELRTQVTPVGRFIVWLAGESGLLRGREESSPVDDA